MYSRFGLVLMVTHACNLKCEYCYTGVKIHRVMGESVGRKAIDRAIASLEAGATLELGPKAEG
jgi:sulfatase maturation enzyme AslB (radical SAM superfamily)